MAKSPEAFRTISEVAEWLDTPAHVLRFWESRFPEVSPVKRAGGRRYYRPDDMRLLGGIKHLLHTEGHTIKSVQERLKSDGTSAISAFSPPLAVDGHGGGDEAPDETGAQTEAAWDGEVLQADIAAVGGTVAARHQGSDDADIAIGTDDVLTEPEADVPPIGFFFDDSDDAAPAEDQTGTFAAPAPEPVDRQVTEEATNATSTPEAESAAPADEAETAGPDPDQRETPVIGAPDIVAGPASEASPDFAQPSQERSDIADRTDIAAAPVSDIRGAEDLAEPVPDVRGGDGLAEPAPDTSGAAELAELAAPAQEAAEPDPMREEDPDDCDGSVIAPLSPAADLRSLTRRDLPPGWRARLPGIVARLERLLEGVD
ncbi:MAG: MerR family transcriptional regulator [Rhodobacteraceae bacterium]|nr:MerR family transcriptional regulator [Paracoccaceae bacterium]